MIIKWFEIYNKVTNKYVTRDVDDNDHTQVVEEFDTYKEAEEWVKHLINKSKKTSRELKLSDFLIKEVEIEHNN